MLFPFTLGSVLISLGSILQFSAHKSFSSLYTIISQIFYSFRYYHEWNPLISFVDCSLVVYRSTTNFCVLFFYPASMLNFLIISSSVCVCAFFGLYMYTYIYIHNMYIQNKHIHIHTKYIYIIKSLKKRNSHLFPFVCFIFLTNCFHVGLAV